MSRKKLSTSRSLEHYVNRNDTINLITVKDIEKCKSYYKKYLKSNKIPFFNSDFDSDKEYN